MCVCVCVCVFPWMVCQVKCVFDGLMCIVFGPGDALKEVHCTEAQDRWRAARLSSNGNLSRQVLCCGKRSVSERGMK